LEANGYRVLTGRNGNEGCALFRQHGVEIRAALLDMVSRSWTVPRRLPRCAGSTPKAASSLRVA
jgi:hypothetical protein